MRNHSLPFTGLVSLVVEVSHKRGAGRLLHQSRPLHENAMTETII